MQLLKQVSHGILSTIVCTCFKILKEVEFRQRSAGRQPCLSASVYIKLRLVSVWLVNMSHTSLT